MDYSCPECGGLGVNEGTRTTCVVCGGTGRVRMPTGSKPIHGVKGVLCVVEEVEPGTAYDDMLKFIAKEETPNLKVFNPDEIPEGTYDGQGDWQEEETAFLKHVHDSNPKIGWYDAFLDWHLAVKGHVPQALDPVSEASERSFHAGWVAGGGK